MLNKIVLSSAEKLANIHRQCFDTPWDEAQFVDLLKLPTTHGFMCDQGFILYSHVLDEMEIMTFCVLPQFRQQGIGMQLLNQLFEMAKQSGVSHVFLEVSAENPNARSLYEKMGFEFLSRREKYYKTSSGFKDAFCFIRKISD